MNKLLIPGVAALALLCAPTVHGEAVVRETTTTIAAAPFEAAGTVTEWAPDRVIIRREGEAEPMPFAFARRVEYVDEAGNPVAREVIRRDAPVTLRYTREGDRMLVDRVVVHRRPAPTEVTRAETATTTIAAPLEAAGTVTAWDRDRVIIRREGVAEPVPFAFARRVEYVDEAGNPVEREVIRRDVPVTIRYTREGDRMLVDRVVVHRRLAPAAVATTETTTTTTTTISGHDAKEIEKRRDKIAKLERELAEHPDRTRLREDLADERAKLERFQRDIQDRR